MPFPYYETHLPKDFVASFGPSALEMQRREIRDRAGILLRLGYGEAETAARCEAWVNWEFELNGKPAIAAEVKKLVGEVFHRSAPRR
ncbi:MAG: hypothetical protein HY904_04200 [Deltaproteobacteria bacterium]|nr:hypothetical protein [Deltaproteobacteria bacterium]